MPEYRTEPLNVPYVSGLLPEGERDRRVALTSFRSATPQSRVPTREVECYECGRRSHVPTSAISAGCVHCHATLNMEDVELNSGTRNLTVRTLGNVMVPPGTVLSHLSVVCRNMTVYGRVSGTIRCTQELCFRESSRVEGEVRARRLVIDRAAEVVMTEAVSVREALVEGKLAADVRAAGVIRVGREGVLRGRCDAADIAVEPGGQYIPPRD